MGGHIINIEPSGKKVREKWRKESDEKRTLNCICRRLIRSAYLITRKYMSKYFSLLTVIEIYFFSSE